MAEKDADLTKALKQAESNKMYFAFIPKGSEGKLIVSKNRVLSNQISRVKKEVSGGSPVIGRCFGPVGKMVFQVNVEPSASFGAAIKKVVHRDTGWTTEPDIRVDPGADAEQHEALLTRMQLAQFFSGKASE